ncbi:MAG: lipoate--protein ligase [Lachnospiraceae bacterium]|nr:lipoate--protein ligase [Lachnospiraceae bacterium]
MKLSYICSDSTNPYNNIALEEYLTFHTGEDECILYLWQNANTVVIGKNQNAYRECKIDKLEEAGGYLARRLSGGGAVYHDLGNLNFTFCVRKKNYNVDKQLQVIVEAVKSFGLNAEKTGRNDIVVDGKKFSGNAFYESGEFAYHHGTIMIDVNAGKLADYLTVSKAKLESKGVQSVRSRVVNLSALSDAITVETMKRALAEAFAKVYEGNVNAYQPDEEAKEEINERKEFFGSKDWLLGNQKNFVAQMETRFSWGEMQLQVETEAGIISGVTIFSDALEDTLPEQINVVLKGCPYEKEALLKRGNMEDVRISEVISWIADEI